MEYLEVVDENNVLTGRKVPKEEVHKNPIWYREVLCFIINAEGKILLQKRASTKRVRPNEWETCVGHVTAGETPEQSMVREIKEETGIDTLMDNLKLIDIVKLPHSINNSFYHYVFSHIYYVKTNASIEDLKLNPDEVCEAKYISIEELKRMITTKDKTVSFSEFDHMERIVSKLEDLLRKLTKER